jgi:transposase InsO family protein
MSFNLQDKIKILDHLDKYGLAATVEAVALNNKTISIKSLYRWRSQRKRLLEEGKSLNLLAPKSKKPKQYRTSKYDLRISNYILYLRKKYPRMGKSKLKLFVDQYSVKYMIVQVSEATIGRIIKKLKVSKLLIEYSGTKEVYLDGSTGKLHSRVQTIKRKLRKPKEVKAAAIGDIVQLDAVTIQIKGQKTYFINAIDLASRIAFSYSCKKLNSANATLCIKEFEVILNTNIKAVQTDNGLENHKHFDQYLNDNGITHYWNRPATPKSNGTIERFNRTIQDECICHHLNLCNSARMAELKEVLTDYLEYYNSIRPHMSLQYLTPSEKYNQLKSFSHM